jgi:hypothetical protein
MFSTIHPPFILVWLRSWEWGEFPHVIGVFQKTDSPVDLEKMITDSLGKLQPGHISWDHIAMVLIDFHKKNPGKPQT